MSDFFRECRTILVPLFAVILAVLILAALGAWDAAAIVGWLGTVLALLGNVIYVTVWDPRGRYPESSPSRRLSRLFRFDRGEQ